jgi:hypothetical protein
MKLTPKIIQSFIKGSGGQTTRQLIIPPKLTGHPFKNVFRLFINHKVSHLNYIIIINSYCIVL